MQKNSILACFCSNKRIKGCLFYGGLVIILFSQRFQSDIFAAGEKGRSSFELELGIPIHSTLNYSKLNATLSTAYLFNLFGNLNFGMGAGFYMNHNQIPRYTLVYDNLAINISAKMNYYVKLSNVTNLVPEIGLGYSYLKYTPTYIDFDAKTLFSPLYELKLGIMQKITDKIWLKLVVSRLRFFTNYDIDNITSFTELSYGAKFISLNKAELGIIIPFH